MKRIATTSPGNDCIYGECSAPGCPGRKGMSGDGHGIHADEWHYTVTADDGLTALRLTVYTDTFPNTVPRDHSARRGVLCDRCGHGRHAAGRCGDVNKDNHWGACRCDCPADPLFDRRYGADLTFHVAFPIDKADVRWWPGRAPEGEFRMAGECDLLPGRFCFHDDTSSLGARTFWKDHGDPSSIEQAPPFWRAFTALFSEKDAAVRASRADERYQRCNHCDGMGVVAKEPR